MHAGDLLERLAKNPLRLASAVNVCAIEKRVARFVGRSDGATPGLAALLRYLRWIPGSSYSPAAVRQAAALQ